jgi:hypothetical protein
MSRAGSTPPVPKARPAGPAESTCSEYPPGVAELARRVVAMLGGRYSAELSIDVDASDAEVERWFRAATLFGPRRRRSSPGWSAVRSGRCAWRLISAWGVRPAR